MSNETVEKTLIGLDVVTRYNNRMYRIDEVHFDKNPESTFHYKGKLTSFVDYCKEYHNIDIKDRSQPLLLTRCSNFYIYFYSR